MSTDYQRYSIQNQAAAIAAFAQQSNLTIVRTYVDEGRSGLRIKGRAGLLQLIDDVNSGQADFDHILVYDVSRWGRFQDVDESAHYEFVCKQKGIKVTYCAEQFDNDDSLLSSIIKNIKRVMAAEFSRELSVKVHIGQCRIVSLGYSVGAPVGYGLRRELVDGAQRPKGLLAKGERKSLQTDRVRIQRGPEHEAAIVRWIFEQLVVEGRSDTEITRQLNRGKVPSPDGVRWSVRNVHTILTNERYAGNLVHNRTTRRLGAKRSSNPPELWVRCDDIIDPIIDREMFECAQKIIAERRVVASDDEMLRRLRLLLHRKGSLSSSIIKSAAGVSCVQSFKNHFGSLRNAFALIGYVPKRNLAWIDSRDAWTAVLTRHAAHVADALPTIAGRRSDTITEHCRVTINGRIRINFLIARQARKLKPHHAPHWRVYRRQKLSGLLAVLRLDAANREIVDYVLLPASEMTKRYLRFPHAGLAPNVARFDTLDQLTREIKTRLGRWVSSPK
jgi:DNA invertase Pin-like site-specific DNA recombinase